MDRAVKPLPILCQKDIDRFWSYVSLGNPDECWPWTGATIKGYGAFRKRPRTLKAHRVAYLLQHGADPGELLVCHTCDNPPCCNGRHLFLGDNTVNTADSTQKGRRARLRGEQQNGARLTEESVRAIRETYSLRSATQEELALQYGVAKRTISAVITRKTWPHVVAADGTAKRPPRQRIDRLRAIKA